jgi:hypothetical protein
MSKSTVANENEESSKYMWISFTEFLEMIVRVSLLGTSLESVLDGLLKAVKLKRI